MFRSALKLNADFLPIEVVPWTDAVPLVMTGKADLIEGFDRMIRSPSIEVQLPAVIRLREYARKANPSGGCTRENILARDEYTCQYCGAQPKTRSGKPALEELTLEHIVPRAASVNNRVLLPWTGRWVPLSGWENLVAACQSCNNKKGCRPLSETNLVLKAFPQVPDRMTQIRILLNKHKIPDEWKDYLPQGSEWRDYWTVELE